MANTVFDIPAGSDVTGKKVMLHDLTQPEASSTQIFDVALIPEILKKEKFSGIYFVDKRFTGEGRAEFTGLTIADISSPNATYLTQLSKAVRGNILAPFPCPFSARNKALEDIAAGEITKACVIILGGNEWNIGSPNSAQNNGAFADCCFSNLNNTVVASLFQNKIDYYFEPNTKMIYFNSAYTITAGWHVDLTDTFFKSGVYGFGYFVQLYGQANGFQAQFVNLDNANAELVFEGRVSLQQYTGFRLNAQRSVSIKLLPNSYSQDSDTFCLGQVRPAIGTGIAKITIHTENFKWGNGLDPEHIQPNVGFGDYWYKFTSQFCGGVLNPLEVYVDEKNPYYAAWFDSFLTNIQTGNNLKFFISMPNAYVKSLTGNLGQCLFSFGKPTATANENIQIKIEADNLTSECPRIFRDFGAVSDSGKFTVDVSLKNYRYAGGGTSSLILANSASSGLPAGTQKALVTVDIDTILKDNTNILVNLIYKKTCYILRGKIQRNLGPTSMIEFSNDTQTNTIQLIDLHLIDKSLRNVLDSPLGPVNVYCKNVHANFPANISVNQEGESITINSSIQNYL